MELVPAHFLHGDSTIPRNTGVVAQWNPEAMTRIVIPKAEHSDASLGPHGMVIDHVVEGRQRALGYLGRQRVVCLVRAIERIDPRLISGFKLDISIRTYWRMPS